MKYAVVRVSDPNRGQHGHSLPAQIQRLQSWGLCWAPYVLTPGQPPGFAVDLGISAYKTDFLKRPAVRRMVPKLQPGDQIVVTRIDRVWRRMSDFCNTVAWLAERKIDLVVLDPPIDFSKSTGRLLAHMLCAFAEFESAIKGERIREAAAAARARKEAGEEAEKNPRKRKDARLQWAKGDYCPVTKEIRAIAPGGRVFIYLRCSHLDSLNSGLGLEAQLAMAMRVVNEMIERDDRLAFGGVYCDEVVSAWKIPFLKRPQGALLSAALQSGDTVVFARLDRGFRNTHDLLVTVPEWLERGVNVKVCDVELDMSTWTGMIVLEVLTLAAKIEAAITSARNKDVAAYLRANGMYHLGDRIQKFFKVVKVKIGGRWKKRRVWDRPKLARYRLLYWLWKNRKRNGLGTMNACVDRVELLSAQRDGRKPIPRWGLNPHSHAKSKKLIYPPWNEMLFRVTVTQHDKLMAAWYASRAGREAMTEVLEKGDGNAQ